MSEGWMEQEIDRKAGAVSEVMWTWYRTVVVKRAPEGKSFDLPVDLHSNPYL